MISASVMNDINSLQPEDQTVVFSLVKSLVMRETYRTEAQKRFEEECRRYEGRQMSMDEIDAIISESRQG